MLNSTLSELSGALKDKKISSVELTRLYLERIARLNGELNAFITVDEAHALAEAGGADARRAKGDAGLLTGIPIAHKDIFCTRGLRTTCGSRMLENYVSPYDAHVVEQLEGAGTALVGKCNMDEFAMGSSTETSHFGPARNPWDQRLVPGGSSGGSAAAVAARLVPATTEDDWYAGLLAGQEYLLSLGITGWQDAIVGRHPGLPDPIGAYLRAASAGTLKANVVGAMWWDRERGIEQVAELIERRREGQAGRFKATSVKMMLDGVAENHTAAMLEPYLDGHGCATETSGLDFIDPDELPRFVTALDREGFQVHFHALGDRAVRNALDAIQAAREANGAAGQRHHLAHLQVVHPDDIPRFAELSATANIQPLWAMHEPQMDELTIPFLGERRSGWQYPFGSLLAAGAPLCAGSDWSVSSPDPLAGAHVAVNRSRPAESGGLAAWGTAPDPFLPEQALSAEVIFAAYTSGSARVNGLDGVTGAIRPGLDADLAIVDADLARGPAGEICQASVLQTWVRGEVAYQQT